jgi:tetratricopeptide (TPR) repeat protein
MAAQDAAATVTPLRMLLLFSAPLVMQREIEIVPITLLPVQQEIETLANTCRSIGVALEIETTIATTERIGHLFATTRQPFDVLHFSGHGSRHLDGSSVLALEDETGMVRNLDATEFRRLIGSQPCRLAFLSACHSAGLAEALLAAGVRHVVAINAADPVIDLAARVFAVRFYAALFAGRSVAEAFAAGCTAVATNDELRQWRDPETLQTLNVREEVKFRLLPENDPVHQQPLVPTPPCGQLTFRRPQWQNTNLSPVAADPFVGRARELHAIAQALRNNRCVAIHGMGGMGKTALAEAAARWQHERNRWRDGVWRVALRNITTAYEARSRIAFALGLAPKTAESDATLASALADRQSLLVLDDLDALLIHDRQGLVGMVRALLGTRFLKLLTTARLDLPGRIHHSPLELTRLTTEDALTAFLTYAPPIEKWGKWTPDEWRDLLRFLDGYPFPIRLTATAMRVARLSLRDLWRRLQANPQGTLRYPGDEEDRETSLAATLDLSYNVLPAAAQRVFALLALFPAGLTRNAAQAIADIEAETLETVVHYGMAEWRGTADYAQCALPEPARRYAEARLAQQMPDALATYAPAALAYFAGLIEAADEAIIKGNERSGITILTLEQPNLEHYLDWGYAHDSAHTGINRAARATAQLRHYWMLKGERNRPEVLARLKRALDSARRSSDTTGEANVLQAIGDVQQFRKEMDAALTSYHEALTLYRALGARLGEANVLQAIGDVQQFRKEMDAALTSYHEALTLYRALGARLGEANVLQAIGDVQQFRDDRDAALTSYHEALTLYRALGARLGEANVRKAIGDVQQFRKEMDAALTSYHEALTLYRALGARLGEANVRKAIGDVQQFRKEMDAALTSYHEALTLYRALGARLGEANVRKAIGDVQQFRKEMDAALTSYHEALTLYRALGDRLGEANVRKAIGDVQQFRDDRDAALTSYHEALTLYRALGDRLGEANVLQAIGDVQQFRDDRDAALTSYHEALTLYRALGDRLGEANVLQAIGDVQQFRDDRDAALTSYHEALTLYRALGARLGEANVLQAIGDVQQFRDDRDAALTSYHEALTLYRALGDRLGEANVLAALSRLRLDDDPAASQQLLEQALVLRRAINDRYSEGADLGNYGIALLQRGRGAEALPYLQRARAVFVELGMAHLVAQMDQLIALASGDGG